MISVRNRNERKRVGLGLEMEETELEEGEAPCYNDADEDSTIDPDIALSYIEEKLQNVLGHFQKDFEGGVSAENLGAKFGGYGSFLPTYQRSPSWSHTRTPPEVHNYDSPRTPKKLHLEDQRPNSLASSSASPSARSHAASGKAVSANNSLKGDGYSSAKHAEESSSKSGVVKKSANPSDQRTLKVRIKVGSENLSTQKNAEIYSGLGLEVSPTSSLDDSPTTSAGLCGRLLDVPEESPTSILEIMTSFPGAVLLSPLSEDLIHLNDKRKLRGKIETKPMNKTNIESSGILVNGSLSGRSSQKVIEQKRFKSSERDDAFSTEITNQKNKGTQNSSISLSKKDDTLGCEELVSNTLKLPLLSSSPDPAKDMFNATFVPLDASKDGVKGEILSAVKEKEHLDSESAEDIGGVEKLGGPLGSSGNISECKKGNLVSNNAVCPLQDVPKAEKSLASDQSESNVSRGRKALSAEPSDPSKQLVVQKEGSVSEEGLKPALEKSSNGSKRKQKVVAQGDLPKDQLMVESSMTSKTGKSSNANFPMLKTDSHDLQKNHEKPRDRYKDFFGDVEFEEDDNESISGEMTSSERLKDPQLVGKRSLSEYPNTSKEKCNGKNSERPRPSDNYPRKASHPAPPLGDGTSSEAPTGMVPLVNEDWVSCDKCQTWRLLPLGTNPKSLPDKWLCKMLTWLPGMNRCSIPEEVTTNALRALYHPAASVPATGSESQHTLLNNSVVTSVGVPSVDGSIHSSNSRKKNIPTSGKNSNLNSGIHSPSPDASGYQHMRHSSSAVEKFNHTKKDKESLAISSDKGTSLKIRSKRESDLEDSRASKRSKSEGLHFDDENWTSDNGGTSSKAGRNSTSLSNNVSGSDRHKYTNHKDLKGEAKKTIISSGNVEMHVAGASDDRLISRKRDDKDSSRKRKSKEIHGSEVHTELVSGLGRHEDSGDFREAMCENDHRIVKKARVSKSGGKDTSESKTSAGTDKKNRSTKDNGPYPNQTQVGDYLKTDMDSVQPSVAANSSSSKVSGSHKNMTSAQEVKGSPVESVSSSPLKISNADKVTSTRRNLVGKDDFHDSGSLTAVTPRRFLGGEDGENVRVGMEEKDAIPTVNDHVTDVYDDVLYQSNQQPSLRHSSEHCQVEEKPNIDKSQNSGSHSKKSRKGLSSHSKDKVRASVSDLVKDNIKASDSSRDSLDHQVHLNEEKSKSRRNKFEEKSSTPSKAERAIGKKDTSGGTLNESSKGQSQKKVGHDGQDVIKSQDKKHNLQREHDNGKLPKKSDRAEVYAGGKSHSLPPLARVQTETVSGSQKENGVKTLAVDPFDNGEVPKAPSQRKKTENQNGQPSNTRHPTPNSLRTRDVEAPSPLRRDSSSQAANNAIKEAKDLKHLADRIKNTGSTDSIWIYFQAAVKFLHGASLLESGSSEATKQNELMHSLQIYSSTAKLCEFCAHEYEKSKDMAAAALAYKCMEVAYMRVVYSSHASACRDRNELQIALQIIPTGESPSSSASDVDNLNHQATTDKAALAKVVNSPQVSGSHTITSRNRTGFLRILNFAQDVNYAMEASRKSRIAFTAASSRLGETPHKDAISSLKKALDFNFQDVEGFLRLVRVAVEVISR
ncbi:hypothetical protein BUALT_Bualt02G0230800 [Buddleja alternifolia]|uniref:CW-type domain-containing protein n=1 Tax=Buddleja alternifolia TaxID=168488 RepID=A0AAV6Y2L0_9LAMI|nr:hypothetical protein BUALT_Bualt02G0230800 [Buddleja alternifolia]